MASKIYAYPGEPGFTIMDEENIFNKDMIEMTGPNPDITTHVASPDGTWIMISDYKKLRENIILKEWPIAQQLEAITEDKMGRPEKLNQLKDFLAKIKETYPKTME